MYTLRKRCLPIFHSTSTTSSPSERATRSAASRIFSNCKQRLHDQCRSTAHENRQTQKSGLTPTRSCDPLRAKSKYMPAIRQKQGAARNEGARCRRPRKSLIQRDLRLGWGGRGSRRRLGRGLGSRGCGLGRIGLVIEL